jgi:hypothetical protein
MAVCATRAAMVRVGRGLRPEAASMLLLRAGFRSAAPSWAEVPHCSSDHGTADSFAATCLRSEAFRWVEGSGGGGEPPTRQPARLFGGIYRRKGSSGARKASAGRPRSVRPMPRLRLQRAWQSNQGERAVLQMGLAGRSAAAMAGGMEKASVLNSALASQGSGAIRSVALGII